MTLLLGVPAFFTITLVLSICDCKSVEIAAPVCRTDCGESFVACAVTQKACRDEYSALYARSAVLFRDRHEPGIPFAFPSE